MTNNKLDGFFGIALLVVVLFICVASAHCQDLPDNPHPQPEVTSPKFFQFRGADDPQNATNRQVWHSKVFVAAHICYVVAVLYDIHHTHQARETYESEVPAIPAIIGLDYVAYRFLSPSLSTEAAVYGVIHYSLDAAK